MDYPGLYSWMTTAAARIFGCTPNRKLIMLNHAQAIVLRYLEHIIFYSSSFAVILIE